MLHAAARRLAIAAAVLLGGTIAVSALLGAVAGADIAHSISIGLYVLGVALLIGCFVFGVRGPLRGMSETGETVPLLGARSVRRATGDERAEATKTAILFFVAGILVILLGSLIDPTHSTF